jgi:hypothetical protein
VETSSKVVIQFVGPEPEYEEDRNNRNGNPIHVNPICGGMVCSRRILGVDKPFWECYT